MIDRDTGWQAATRGCGRVFVFHERMGARENDLEGMSPEEPIEWYLARDGRQYGPLSDAKMRKFRELGHLMPNDLVWRKGVANWMPADTVFDLAKKAPG
jgi:GYF domain 2